MGAANAQFGRGVGDWVTNGADAQRSSWIRTDAKISRESLQKPGFEFLWKLKLDANAKQSFAAPVLLNSYIGYRGFRSLAFVGVTSNKVVGIDTDLGKIEWQKQLPGDGSSSSCAGLMTSLTRPATAAFPGAGGGGGGIGGRSGPAKSAVGEPDEGSVILQQVAARAAASGPGGPGGRPPGGFQRMPLVVHTLTSDGMLNSLLVSNGEPYQPPVRFLPGNAIALGLIVLDNVAYAAASPGCGAAPDAVIAVHLTSKEVAMWKLDSGSIAGSAGPAIGPDGILYVSTTGGELAALEPKTLKLKTVYKAGQPFTSSPVIFEFKDKVLIAVATKDGRVHLLDSKALDKPTATSDAANLNSGALASWQDSAGARWIFGTSSNAVVALKVLDQNGAPVVQPAWSSRDIASPVAPIVVNGVVFTASAQVLYALDAKSGKELWNSGKAITGAIRGGGLSAGNSQVYLATNDGTFYAFGFPIEH
jgi:outer membrane protein assembly factor BamB